MQIDQCYWEDHSKYNSIRTQWNSGGQTWQAGVPNNTANPQTPNPALPATPSVRPPFIRNLINNNQTLGSRPPAQLNASDTVEALETNPNKPIDPNAPVNNSTFPEDKEALWANRFHSSNKPWIDVPLDVQGPLPKGRRLHLVVRSR
ncbi:hypothetical protein C0992_003679 [Termitomyces sp. T32_za158]|nr:hypothetical protein C0992_003679 [Termitomyces sp. T32_za158]